MGGREVWVGGKCGWKGSVGGREVWAEGKCGWKGSVGGRLSTCKSTGPKALLI